MRTYVCTFGYDSRRVTRPVLSHGVDGDDRVVLVRPDTGGDDGESDQRAETAHAEVRQTFDSVEPRVRLDTVELPPTDFDEATRQSLDVLRSADGETLAVLGGGAREIYLPFAVAALVARDTLSAVLQFGDTDHEVRSLSLPDLLASASAPARETLALVDDLGGETTLPALADASDRAKSTVGRHLDELETAGLVETESEGQTRLIGLTLSGELQLERA